MGASETNGAISSDVMGEVFKALRLAKRYGGKFGRDELEYAAILLEEDLPERTRPSKGNGRY